ncbi:MAG: hypothetical protein OEM18_05210 [Nitrosopumilus sp.]|nr:hypothetical protein [Nitrosopumilus sp.]MDH3501792.1 hypothetical protein [Nitrosopumilus sp.]
MDEFSEKEKIEISRILESIQGRLDKRLIKLTMDLVMKTKWTQESERELYKKNIKRIPEKSIESVLMGSHIGQIYQVTLDFVKKMGFELKPLQKNILKEFIFFLVLLRTEKEQGKIK